MRASRLALGNDMLSTSGATETCECCAKDGLNKCCAYIGERHGIGDLLNTGVGVVSTPDAPADEAADAATAGLATLFRLATIGLRKPLGGVWHGAHELAAESSAQLFRIWSSESSLMSAGFMSPDCMQLDEPSRAVTPKRPCSDDCWCAAAPTIGSSPVATPFAADVSPSAGAATVERSPR